MKSVITKEEYQQLLGLMVLFKRHEAAEEEIIRAGNALISDIGEPFHSSAFADECYSRSASVDQMLRNHKIEIAPCP